MVIIDEYNFLRKLELSNLRDMLYAWVHIMVLDRRNGKFSIDLEREGKETGMGDGFSKCVTRFIGLGMLSFDGKKYRVIGIGRNVPSWEDFRDYSIGIKSDIDVEDLRLKYLSWKVNDWCDLNGSPIRNWRSKILNNMRYMKVVKGGLKDVQGIIYK